MNAVAPKSRGTVIPPSVFVVADEIVIVLLVEIPITVVPVETKLPRTSCPREIEVVVIPIVVAAPVAIVADLLLIAAVNADTPVVLTPRIWSALASIIPTLKPFAQEPGFLAATTYTGNWIFIVS